MNVLDERDRQIKAEEEDQMRRVKEEDRKAFEIVNCSLVTRRSSICYDLILKLRKSISHEKTAYYYHY